MRDAAHPILPNVSGRSGNFSETPVFRLKRYAFK